MDTHKRKYEDALERAIIAHKDEDIHLKAILEGIFPELKKYEDEWMCNIAINACKYMMENFENSAKQYEEALAWLEKQGEYANFRNKIQVGDKVTRNRDGVLVNLSQLKRVANPSEKQGEQNPAWSEEDKNVINHLIDICKIAKKFIQFASCTQDDIIKCQDWLTSLKERIQL